MSFPNIPNITPALSVTTVQTIPLLLSSIALEELALAHIVNTEAEKLQFVLGTLEGGRTLSLPVVTISNLLDINSSVQKTLRDVIKKEMLLEFKFENVLDLVATIAPPTAFLFVSNRDRNTVAIFDVTNRTSPVFLREFGAGQLNGPTGLAITGTTLYVSNQFDNTIAIYDISVPPSPVFPLIPLFVKKFGTGDLNGPTGLAITGNTLYVANQFADTVAIYDITIPPNPVHVDGGDFSTGVHGPFGLAITGNTLYVANQFASFSPVIFDNTVEVYDITTPPNPVHVNEFGGVGELDGPAGLAIAGNVLFVANFGNSTIERYNITIPPNPVHVDEFGAGEVSGPTGLVIYPPSPCYVANQFANTVSIYDVSVPSAPMRFVRDFGSGVLHAPTGLAVFIPPNPV